jgi:hypothetical protein
MLSIAPVLLHHLALFNHTVVHDFNVLKTSVFFVLAAGVLTGRLLARLSSRGASARWGVYAGTCVVVVAVAVGSAWLFGQLHKLEYVESRSLGDAIAAEAQPDEVVFVSVPEARTLSLYVPPNQITWYAGRNYVAWNGDLKAARRVLDADAPRTGVFFMVDFELQVQKVGYFGADGDPYESREQARSTLGAWTVTE